MTDFNSWQDPEKSLTYVKNLHICANHGHLLRAESLKQELKERWGSSEQLDFTVAVTCLVIIVKTYIGNTKIHDHVWKQVLNYY